MFNSTTEHVLAVIFFVVALGAFATCLFYPLAEPVLKDAFTVGAPQ